jgi:hypothetical protein
MIDSILLRVHLAVSGFATDICPTNKRNCVELNANVFVQACAEHSGLLCGAQIGRQQKDKQVVHMQVMHCSPSCMLQDT